MFYLTVGIVAAVVLLVLLLVKTTKQGAAAAQRARDATRALSARGRFDAVVAKPIARGRDLVDRLRARMDR